ncbi:single-stranded-DNA-specific exonuclease RecJ [Arenibacter sp. 6A1]|uniref:single-stranded-DNA-specific exonuclease RecJ n=1 Tax=Arenibacter sp. 6A1 TaxID=2720391 RepID=UPI0014475DBB|nr:single-stranded-DNA-specific exonuclease RecJ [Arenibacter sp. 6A1]NKI26573.1 single-stranded-DNA-specific exonuclease RecJ [Arenibacter sp. 6A1]
MRWTVKPKSEQAQVDALAKALNVEYLVAELLLQRGITTFEEAKQFFRPQLSQLHDPFLMKDMDAAVLRIEQAMACGENILVYGDYDVDGTTAVALVSSYLESYYPNVATYIPDRYKEGYGVSFQGIDFAEDNEFSLIIALDCGIKAIDKVAYAKEKGIDFIICDHHRPGKEIPDAVAVLDPKREDCSYPYDELCGCGVGFKLIQALGSRNGETIDDLIPYLDLVATAIGADIVPITGENRVLAFWGLKVINSRPRTGFQAIINQLKKQTLTITDVVFVIAPRINAAGRMEHGQHAVNLLKVTDLAQAEKFAAEIENYNTDRRSLDQEIAQEALLQIEENEEQEGCTSVVYKATWHKGVIGIVASRLIETYYRPTLVFTKSGEKLAASARSVKGFDVYQALEGCAETIEQFGGHKYAAGLTLLEENYEAFKAKFEEVVAQSIDPKLLTPEIVIDANISLEEVTPKLLRIIKQFEPFGPGNPSPVFMAENLKDNGYAKGVGQDESHLKMAVTQNGTPPIGCIGFNLGNKLEVVTGEQPFSAVFALDENEWQGNVSLQLKLKDIRQ